jgi:hypothetical protein
LLGLSLKIEFGWPIICKEGGEKIADCVLYESKLWSRFATSASINAVKELHVSETTTIWCETVLKVGKNWSQHKNNRDTYWYIENTIE